MSEAKSAPGEGGAVPPAATPTCPKCGFENPRGFKFCGGCGADLAAAAEAPRAETDAERRQVTVIFCDLVGFTELSTRLDPEDLRELVRGYQSLCDEIVERFDGHIAQYLGDGVLIYFGFPTAHEDDAQRAVYTALAIVDSMEAFDERERSRIGYPVTVRIGLHTGPVVVGAMGSGASQEQLALGETPNIAARLQTLAEPGSVAISSATHALVKNSFDCEPLGARDLKGASGPVEIFRALRPADEDDRFDRAIKRGLVPLAGRERELDVLLALYAEARRGHRRAALVHGDAGIGKSRLRHEFQMALSESDHIEASGYCSPYHQTSSFFPIARLLEQLFRFEKDARDSEKLRKIERGVEGTSLEAAEAVPLIAGVLAVDFTPAYEQAQLSPQAQKQRVLAVLRTLLSDLSQTKPCVVIIIEDIHWMDPSSRELLDLLLTRALPGRLLFLFTARPSFDTPWASPAVSLVKLEPLDTQQVEAMVLSLTDQKRLPAQLLKELIERTDGVPIFVEELTKTLVESDQLRLKNGEYELLAPLSSIQLPVTLQDSLTARLDRLTTGKSVAQIGAVIGREFSYELLQAVGLLTERELDQGLKGLVGAGLVFKSGNPPKASYLFRHALVRDAAYELLLKRTRREYHRTIAQTLTASFPQVAQVEPGILAHHYTEGGLSAEAIDQWQRAAHLGILQSANVEAVSSIEKGLAVLESSSEEVPDRDVKELQLQALLGAALSALRGFASPEVARTYSRAEELAETCGEVTKLFWIHRGLWYHQVARGNLQDALRMGERILRESQAADDPLQRLAGHFMVGGPSYMLGSPEIAAFHLREAIALDSPERERPSDVAIEDPGVTSLSQSGIVRWILGRPDSGLEHSQAAVRLAERLAHPFSVGSALTMLGWVRQFRGDKADLASLMVRLLALSEELQFPLWAANARVLLGWSTGDREDVESMKQAVQALLEAGLRISLSYLFSVIADFCLRHGLKEEGLQAITQGLSKEISPDERFFHSELHRLQGELSLLPPLDSGAEMAAESAFARALEISREQKARSLELRAAISMAALLGGSGRRDEGAQMLSSIYGGFDEGFESRDLRRAAHILSELRPDS